MSSTALLFRRGEPCFYAFDLLWCEGEDLRHLPLIERKLRLLSLVPRGGERLLYYDVMSEDHSGVSPPKNLMKEPGQQNKRGLTRVLTGSNLAFLFFRFSDIALAEEKPYRQSRCLIPISRH